MRAYATVNVIQSAILGLRKMKQKSNDSETSYSTRLEKAFPRCGNVHSAEDRSNIFIDGLDPMIRTLGSRRRKERRKTTYLELFQYAQAEGDALRVRRGLKAVRTRQAVELEDCHCSVSLQRVSVRSGYH